MYHGLQIQAPPSREQSSTSVTTAFINELKQAALELQNMDFEFSVQPAEQSLSLSPTFIKELKQAALNLKDMGLESIVQPAEQSFSFSPAFINQLRQAALELEDTDVTSRASTPSTATLLFSQDMDTLTTTTEMSAYEEPESKSQFADNFLNKLREAAEFGFSSEDEMNENLKTEDQSKTKDQILFL